MHCELQRGSSPRQGVLTGHTEPHSPTKGMAASQDCGRSLGRGAEGLQWTSLRGWAGALLSQDSMSGLLRDDPSADKTFLKSLVQKSNIYLAGIVSLYKVSPSEQLWMTPRIQMLEGRPSPASYSYRDQGSDCCKKQSTRQWFPISEGSESVRSALPLLRREDSPSRGIQNVCPPQGTPSSFHLSGNTHLGGLTERTKLKSSYRGLTVEIQ